MNQTSTTPRLAGRTSRAFGAWFLADQRKQRVEEAEALPEYAQLAPDGSPELAPDGTVELRAPNDN